MLVCILTGHELNDLVPDSDLIGSRTFRVCIPFCSDAACSRICKCNNYVICLTVIRVSISILVVAVCLKHCCRRMELFHHIMLCIDSLFICDLNLMALFRCQVCLII